MTNNTLDLRSVSFAYLVGPPRLITRKEASKIHTRVCDALKLDEIVFGYKSGVKGSSTGFNITLQH